jgi:molybdopterin converting factor small subunit
MSRSPTCFSSEGIVQVSFYGKLTDRFGSAMRHVECPASGVTDTELCTLLAGDDADLIAELVNPRVRLVVNSQILERHLRLHNDDEIAFIPPVSGG